MEDHKHIYERVTPAVAYCDLCGKKKYIGKVKPDPETVTIEKLWNKSFNLPTTTDRVLYYILYLTAGRISEILTLRKKDFEINHLYNEKAVVVNLFTLKNRKRKYRHLPIHEDSPIVAEMLKEIFDYLERYEDDEEIFKGISRNSVQLTFAKYIEFTVRAYDANNKTLINNYTFNLHPHYLRHCRLTHLRNKGNLDTNDLVNYAGWSDARPVSTYISEDWRSMFKRMIRGSHE